MKGREKELEFFLAGSLEKVFPDKRPEEWKVGEKLCILRGGNTGCAAGVLQKAWRKVSGAAEISL